MRFLSPAVVLLVCPLISAGCTSSEVDDAGAHVEAESGSLALVQVERFVDGDGASLRVVAGAKVARYRAIDGDALLALLGAESVDAGACVLASGLTTPAMSPGAQVELLSVGDITLRSGEGEARLEPRLFPALAGTASGWFYAMDGELSAPRIEADELLMRAPGRDGLGAFEVAMAAPRDLLDVDVDGSSLDGEVLVERGRDLKLTWDAEDPRDRIEIEILAGGSVLGCACHDDGRFSIPSESLMALEADDNGAIVVRRVRGASFDMSGVDAAYARLATTRSATLTLR